MSQLTFGKPRAQPRRSSGPASTSAFQVPPSRHRTRGDCDRLDTSPVLVVDADERTKRHQSHHRCLHHRGLDRIAGCDKRRAQTHTRSQPPSSPTRVAPVPDNCAGGRGVRRAAARSCSQQEMFAGRRAVMGVAQGARRRNKGQQEENIMFVREGDGGRGSGGGRDAAAASPEELCCSGAVSASRYHELLAELDCTKWLGTADDIVD